jgi:TetR/AcrR family fatty acid metabolism transcriptional regulator
VAAAGGAWSYTVNARRDSAADKRRLILDAAIRVFARQGFHRCRVSDIAREADVAYGLVYHYFRSKDEVLDTLFTERWTLLLEAIAEADRSECSAREKLHSIAAFIIDSYRNDPDLMKVIIVEVTRAVNTFGRAHLTEIRHAYDSIAAIVSKGQDEGTFRTDISSEFATLCFYGAIEQLLTAWIFEEIVMSADEFDQATLMLVETVCDGLAVRSQVPGVTT